MWQWAKMVEMAAAAAREEGATAAAGSAAAAMVWAAEWAASAVGPGAAARPGDGAVGAAAWAGVCRHRRCADIARV